MTEVERIVDQYDRVMSGSAWHGDPIWKLLDGISAECAASRPIAVVHTIWELVTHMTYWETVGYRRIMNLAVEKASAKNFPPMPKASAANWRKTLKEFRASNRNFRKALTQLDPARLDVRMARDKRKSAYVEAHGVIQHHVYHAGQIAILRKAFEAESSLQTPTAQVPEAVG
jgi:uncharacterized damage-inducible protein DinB